MTDFSKGKDRVRPMKFSDLALVLKWRNHPDINKFMLTQHEITMDEHRKWFEIASKDSTRQQLLFEDGNGIPLGYVQLTGATEGGVVDWGFYISPSASKGTGRRLGKAALDYCFEIIGVHKVCGQALGFNEASIRFHRLLGFQQEGVFRQQHQIEEKYYDLICFGLLKIEWSSPESRGSNG